ncbi:hypothetical protein SK128_011455 [Halocaridina rubra]|uniref:Uncharacterized protein n=1 Tax=Halocaridina rubra TaxID=373956 RepID=A0AAN9A765_HALRR
MKTILVLLAALTFAVGQDFECHCGLFVTIGLSTLEVYRLLPFNTQSCEELIECSLICFREWDIVNSNGGMDYIPPGGSATVEEQSCFNLNSVHLIPDCDPTPVYNYYRMCEYPWTWDGGQMDKDLCCANGLPC